MSQHKAVTEADVQDVVEEAGFDVRAIHFDTSGAGRVAYIRLEPPAVKPEAGAAAALEQVRACHVRSQASRGPGEALAPGP